MKIKLLSLFLFFNNFNRFLKDIITNKRIQLIPPFVIIVGLFLCIETSMAQTSGNIINGSISTCDYILYDDGGVSGLYSTSNDYTMTICATTGEDLHFLFNDLELGVSWATDEDILIVYDGAGTGGPILYDSQNGTASGIYSSSSGCITIELQTDPHFIYTDPGNFEMYISCALPETCSDGILNNGEVQIDCGGPNCTPCWQPTACSENIVVNGDFETLDAFGCENNEDSELHLNYTSCAGWYGTTDVLGPMNGTTPDYWTINGCGVNPNIVGGTGPCYSGQGAIGMFVGAEEIQSQLATPLEAGREYCLSVDVGVHTNHNTSDLFFWFHNETFASGDGFYDLVLDNGAAWNIVSGPIGAIPQIVNDSSNEFTPDSCHNLISSFCALGGEQYVVVGGSYDIKYLIVDNLSVKESCPLNFDSQITASGTPDFAGSCIDLYVETSNQEGGCQITNDFTFQWYENGVLMVGQTSDTLLNICPMENTIYSVEITYRAGCSSFTKPEGQTTHAIIRNPSSITEHTNDQLNLYPNPSRKNITVDIDHSLMGSEFEIVDVFGKRVFKSHFNNLSNSVTISEYSDGIYFLKVQGTNILTRFVKG